MSVGSVKPDFSIASSSRGSSLSSLNSKNNSSRLVRRVIVRRESVVRSYNLTGSGLTRLWQASRLVSHRTLPTRVQVMERNTSKARNALSPYRRRRDYTVLSREVPEHYCVGKQGSCRSLRGLFLIWLRWNSLGGHTCTGLPTFDGMKTGDWWRRQAMDGE